jgi:hypothetical protein
LHILILIVYQAEKKNGKDAKEVSLIGQGFQAYIDHLFLYLPFSTVKQAHQMLAKEMSDEPWTIKRDEIKGFKAEHLLEQAPADLRMGWKAWIAELWYGKEGAVAAAVIPVDPGPSRWNHVGDL